MRRFAVENALYWLSDFRFDGLRLDAVHAIAEPGRTTLLHELSEAVGTLAAQTAGTSIWCWKTTPTSRPARSAQRSAAREISRAMERRLSPRLPRAADRRDRRLLRATIAMRRAHLRARLRRRFAYQGEPRRTAGASRAASPARHLPPTAFVNFLQNHDQIGNRALGERLSVLAPPAALEAALAVTLLAPAPPLMFMGEEWGARRPFPFFCDFKGDLADAVREGRRGVRRGLCQQRGDECPIRWRSRPCTAPRSTGRRIDRHHAAAA